MEITNNVNYADISEYRFYVLRRIFDVWKGFNESRSVWSAFGCWINCLFRLNFCGEYGCIKQ